MTYSTIPKLAETLYSEEFVIKVDGKEIYQSKFYSAASSA